MRYRFVVVSTTKIVNKIDLIMCRCITKLHVSLAVFSAIKSATDGCFGFKNMFFIKEHLFKNQL